MTATPLVDIHGAGILLLQACAACTAALDVVDGDAAARDDQVLLQLSVLERLLSLVPQEVG
jgi:hypothetical protein